MRQAKVLFKEKEAGILTQLDDGSFSFCYHEEWVSNEQNPAISLSFPKRKEAYRSDFLFPFFYNMLPEGANKQSICHSMKIDTSDDFGLLLITAQYDTIGAVRIIKK
ncbi:MAG: HipA N-terminal domain-containing protein [Cytophagales bacterium]|nr:HipA N-terminal domain-containing protein [Cytophagales bacterium]